MATNYRISIDRHETYGIKGRGKYGLMIAPVSMSAGNVKELPSEKELRADLDSLGYTQQGIDNILELLSDNKARWNETRDFDETAVAALGF
jgi:hypothetical protein